MAADCVQEAFISAFRRAGSYRAEAAVTTWLHRIVVNACLDRLRRERSGVRRAGDLAEVDLPDRHDRHSRAETGLEVRAALARLPERSASPSSSSTCTGSASPRRPRCSRSPREPSSPAASGAARPSPSLLRGVVGDDEGRASGTRGVGMTSYSLSDQGSMPPAAAAAGAARPAQRRTP